MKTSIFFILAICFSLTIVLGEDKQSIPVIDIYSVKSIKDKEKKENVFGENTIDVLDKKLSSLSFVEWMNLFLESEIPGGAPPFIGSHFYFLAAAEKDKGVVISFCTGFPNYIEIRGCLINKKGEVLDISKPKTYYIENKALYDYLVKFLPPEEVKKQADAVRRWIEESEEWKKKNPQKKSTIKEDVDSLDLDLSLDINSSSILEDQKIENQPNPVPLDPKLEEIIKRLCAANSDNNKTRSVILDELRDYLEKRGKLLLKEDFLWHGEFNDYEYLNKEKKIIELSKDNINSAEYLKISPSKPCVINFMPFILRLKKPFHDKPFENDCVWYFFCMDY